jgi:NAD(P)H-flavin reductase
LRRAYSIASAPDPARLDELEIAVTRVADGAASGVLHALEPGAKVVVDGPHGFFTREDAHQTPALFIGTGTGVCPLRAMIEHELRSVEGPRLQLLFGCRSEADILWSQQFEDWARTHPRFGFHVTLSQPGPEWLGLRGYVQAHLPGLVGGEPRPHLYVCGLTRMVSEVRKIAKEQLGYDRRWIHSERYD